MKTGTVRFTCVRRAELLLLPSLRALISSGSFSRQLCYVSHSHLLMIQVQVAVAAIAKSLLSLSLFFPLRPVFKRLINCACMTASSASQEALQAPDLQAPANSLVCTVPVPGPQRSDIAIRLSDSRTPGASPHARTRVSRTSSTAHALTRADAAQTHQTPGTQNRCPNG